MVWDQLSLLRARKVHVITQQGPERPGRWGGTPGMETANLDKSIVGVQGLGVLSTDINWEGEPWKEAFVFQKQQQKS